MKAQALYQDIRLNLPESDSNKRTQSGGPGINTNNDSDMARATQNTVLNTRMDRTRINVPCTPTSLLVMTNTSEYEYRDRGTGDPTLSH
jgi:hypothetical protein